jgi:uncharacterized protein YndB with AHSA1/START domain
MNLENSSEIKNMAAKIKATKDFTGREFVITRVINAPCKMVFRAWTDPKQMVQWWSPADIECRSVTADLKIGGAYRIHMVSEDGDHIATGKYKEIVPDKRLQFTWRWEKNDRHQPMEPDTMVTVEFKNLGKTTRLTLIHEGFPEKEFADDHNQGWTSAIEKFARLIEQNKIKA